MVFPTQIPPPPPQSEKATGRDLLSLEPITSLSRKVPSGRGTSREVEGRVLAGRGGVPGGGRARAPAHGSLWPVMGQDSRSMERNTMSQVPPPPPEPGPLALAHSCLPCHSNHMNHERFSCGRLHATFIWYAASPGLLTAHIRRVILCTNLLMPLGQMTAPTLGAALSRTKGWCVVKKTSDRLLCIVLMGTPL